MIIRHKNLILSVITEVSILRLQYRLLCHLLLVQGQINLLIVVRNPHPLPSPNAQKVCIQHLCPKFLNTKQKHMNLGERPLHILSSHFSHRFCIFFRFACCDFFFPKLPSYKQIKGGGICFGGPCALAST